MAYRIIIPAIYTINAIPSYFMNRDKYMELIKNVDEMKYVIDKNSKNKKIKEIIEKIDDKTDMKTVLTELLSEIDGIKLDLNKVKTEQHNLAIFSKLHEDFTTDNVIFYPAYFVMMTFDKNFRNIFTVNDTKINHYKEDYYITKIIVDTENFLNTTELNDRQNMKKSRYIDDELISQYVYDLNNKKNIIKDKEIESSVIIKNIDRIYGMKNV